MNTKYHIYFVYILKCSDGTYYTGITNDVDRRLREHESGEDKKSYTYSRRPIKLVFYADFSNVEYAIEKEKQIKKWSKRKKEALINDDFELLPNLAKKKFNK
ncbi:MAG: GIY-YIG nuclease family protein [Flavobacteriales bacterium]|nr:GIY-YIG nuclease family protein [Flavobacteriales bacterium]